jgi:DNA-binding NarL/FixJ family response regulator
MSARAEAERPTTRTVLLVEDEPDTREILCSALKRAGYTCLTADGPASALAQAKSAGFVDVVVTDVVMGGDDRAGLKLLRALRDAGVYAPLVVITAFADVEKVKFALNEGAAHLLEKPFAAPELLRAVERACQQGGGAPHAVDAILARAGLTEKERTVAKALLEGLTAVEIAARESNSEKTIRQHVTQVYAKCGVTSRAELFRRVYKR